MPIGSRQGRAGPCPVSTKPWGPRSECGAGVRDVGLEDRVLELYP